MKFVPLVLFLALGSIGWAEGVRIIPAVRATQDYDEEARRARDYEAAPEDRKSWDRNRPLPRSWADAGMRADAELMFTRGYLDGGSTAYFFKDSGGRYFVFGASTPIGAGSDNKVVPLERFFFIGAAHASVPGAVAVPVGSETDRFLLSILAVAATNQPPLPSPPRGEGWEGLQPYATPQLRSFTDDQRRRLKLGPGALGVLQGLTADELKQLATEDLGALLLAAPNPLRKNQASVVVVMFPVNQADDRLLLEGYKPPADFCFLHESRLAERNYDTAEWGFFFLPIAPITRGSAGFGFDVNYSGYARPEPPAGYQSVGVQLLGTGRMFK